MEEQLNNQSLTRTLSDQQGQNYGHLVEWAHTMIQSEVCSQGDSNKCITFDQLGYILHKISQTDFDVDLTSHQVQLNFVKYFYREFGYYVNFLLNKKQPSKLWTLAKLILYCGIYAQPNKRQWFVFHIMKLSEQTQRKIIQSIDQIEQQLKDIRQWDRMVQNIKKLQAENSQLREEINQAQQERILMNQYIQELKGQLEDIRCERNSFVIQKRKTLSNFSLNSLAEYQDLCFNLRNENQLLLARQLHYLNTIKDLQNQLTVLKQGLSDYQETIGSLTSKCQGLQKNYEQLNQQYSNLQQNMLPIDSKIQNTSKDTLNNLQSTFDDPKLDIKQSRNHNIEILEDDLFLQTGSSGFSKNNNTSVNFNKTGKSSAWNVFNSTKNKLLLNQKIRVFQQKLQELQLKILELQGENSALEQRQRYYMKKDRKMQQVLDEFRTCYSQTAGCEISFTDSLIV